MVCAQVLKCSNVLLVHTNIPISNKFNGEEKGNVFAPEKNQKRKHDVNE